MINPTQKPVTSSYRFGKLFCRPGGNALVMGCGAGGDVFGLVAAGLNVVAFESDPVQTATVQAWANELAPMNDFINWAGHTDMRAQHLEEALSVLTVDAVPDFIRQRVADVKAIEEREKLTPAKKKRKATKVVIMLLY
jgi:hypothetical protein